MIKHEESDTLESQELPTFSKICPEKIYSTVESLIKENEKIIKTILTNKNPTWENFQEPLDQANNRLDNFWSQISHMNSVANTPELRESYNSCLPLISEYYTKINQNKKMYATYKKIKSSDKFYNLNTAKRKSIDIIIKNFQISGVDLPNNKKNKIKEIDKNLSKLMNDYSNNVLDATMGWEKLITDKTILSGIPESVLNKAKQLAYKKHKKLGYLLTLDSPCYIPTITYCNNRSLRQEIYTAYCTRASDLGTNIMWDNSSLIDNILLLRHEMATLLNFKNYAEYSLSTNMETSPKKIISFLNYLAEKCKPKAKQELKNLQDFSLKKLQIKTLHPWDINYCSEKLKTHLYKVSQEEFRPWFPVNKVLEGLFSIINNLYDISIKPTQSSIDSWHPDVLFYSIFQNNNLIAHCYLDLYARENKQPGAWMDECRVRVKLKDKIQLPIAYIVCNFSNPTTTTPALLTHDEVITLFHEFGHGLHHMLTKINYLSVSGINGVPWDAVELPSQFMENWCWDKKSIRLISTHWKTKKPISNKKINQLLDSKNFNPAISLIRQLEMGLFDMLLHKNYYPKICVQTLLDEVRKKISVILPSNFNRMQHSFTHIFSGGYAAGYYSYIWAEILSADAFSAFEESDIFNKKIGQKFLKTFLEKGGSVSPSELFITFRGREPSSDAFLRHHAILT